MTPSEIQLHTLVDHHAAPHGYAIIAFEYFERDMYYKIRLARFDKSGAVTLIIFPDELEHSVNNKMLSPFIVERFKMNAGLADSPAVA